MWTRHNLAQSVPGEDRSVHKFRIQAERPPIRIRMKLLLSLNNQGTSKALVPGTAKLRICCTVMAPVGCSLRVPDWALANRIPLDGSDNPQLARRTPKQCQAAWNLEGPSKSQLQSIAQSVDGTTWPSLAEAGEAIA